MRPSTAGGRPGGERDKILLPGLARPISRTRGCWRSGTSTVRCLGFCTTESSISIEVDLAEDEPYPGFLKQTHELADRAHLEDDYPLPMSVSFTYAGKSTPRPGERWAEEYHHVPMAGVMVDRSDYRQPS